MGKWGEAYYRATQGGSGGPSGPREKKLLYTPADNARELAAIEKRNRKAARKALNAAKISHTHEAKLVIKP